MAPRNIWLLDGDADVRDALEFFLGAEGYLVRQFRTAEALMSEPLVPAGTCLIIDQRLPTVDGLQVIELLRARGGTTPVVLLTSCVSDEVLARCVQINVPVVEKPLHNDDLANILARF